MAQLYIVDYWVPFPSSEYGGLEVYIARNKIQLLDFIVSRADAYDKECYPDYKDLIKHCVDSSKEFYLTIDYSNDPKLVSSFIT